MISIITYDTPHRKTQDLIQRLLMLGYTDLDLIATPWEARKNHVPIYKHRPSKATDVMPELMAERLGIKFRKMPMEDVASYFDVSKPEHILIAGAGILPEELAKNYDIINSHPGYLPNVKGLDALKWAILEGHPVGVTTHFVSEKADEGRLIEQKEIPLYYEDSFYSFAYRQYEMEMDMMAESIAIVNDKTEFQSLADDQYVAHRRMSHHLEIKMMDVFEKRKASAPSFRESLR